MPAPDTSPGTNAPATIRILMLRTCAYWDEAAQQHRHLEADHGYEVPRAVGEELAFYGSALHMSEDTVPKEHRRIYPLPLATPDKVRAAAERRARRERAAAAAG